MRPPILLSFLAFLAACDDSADDDTGTPVPEAPWPEWAWMPWAWEHEPTQTSTLDLVDGYQSRDIPLGAVILDAAWATGESSFTWDAKRFPDPRSLVGELHARGVRVLLWVAPGIDVRQKELWNHARENGWFMQQTADSGPAMVDWWTGEASLLDYFNPDAVAWWRTLREPVLDLGIDGWRCEGLDAQVRLAPYSPHLGRTVERSEYSDLYYRDFFDHTREILGEDRIVTARPVDNDGYGTSGEDVTYAPRDINWAGWVGDQDAFFFGIQDALDNMYWSAEAGYVAFGPDIGGYREDGSTLGRTRELFLRSAGIGAFSPVMVNGGLGEHRPWAFDDEVAQAYADFAEIHVALLPWLRERGAAAFAEERSMFSFVDRTSYAWMLADDLFVVPPTDEGESFTVTFPEGDAWIWVFDTGQRFLGGTTITLTIPYETFPAFVREGSGVLDLLPAR